MGNSKAVSKSSNGKNASDAVGREFQALAAIVSAWVGSKWAFTAALLLIAGWAVTGPYFHYSDTWQLVVNTATTIITFLMVFLIQNTQNRDGRAIHLKLDEIIRSIRHAHNEMIDIEKLSDEELETLSGHFEKIRAECQRRKRHGIKSRRN
jgi:low affinity Fe/Cu permease